MLIELPLIWLIIINALAWFCIHMGVSALFRKVPDEYYEKESRWFEAFSWEDEGRIWQKLFKVKEWKDLVPEASSFVEGTYSKESLQNTEPETIKKFITETKRGEQVHWFTMLPAPLFFLFNPPWAGWIIIAYALIANLPFIIIQRYNRPRLKRLYKLALRKEERLNN